jgi:hypothetical protein
VFDLPRDRAEAICVLSAGLGCRTQAIKMVNNAGLPGINPISASAAATGSTLPQAARSAAGAVPKGPPGVGPLGPAVAVITAAQILQAAQQQGEARALLAVAQRFNLNPDVTADILAAEAYLWIHRKGPWVFLQLPNDRHALDSVGQALMNYERDHPTTLRRSDQGDQQAIHEVHQTVNDALYELGLVRTEIATYRASAVDAKLSADSKRCRALLGIQTMNWRAHHLIPFAVVASLPPPVQMAFVKAGWVMDRVQNLMALPANFPTYLQMGRAAGPVHKGPHTIYSRDVLGALSPLAATSLAMPPPQLLDCLSVIENKFRAKLLQIINTPIGYHPTIP